MKDPKRAEHGLSRKEAGAARRHLVTSNQESTDPLVDVVINRPVRWQSSAIAEVRAPASQHAVELVSHFRPCTRVARNQNVAHLGLEPLHALLRRTCAQIPMTILPVMVRAEARMKKRDVTCPNCNAGFRRVEISSWRGAPGE